jgi:hypothetical protein
MPGTIKRRTEILIEEHTFVRQSANAGCEPCSICGSGAMMTALDEAARSLGTSVRRVCRWVEEGRVHFRETPQGALEVCLSSLREQLKPD